MTSALYLLTPGSSFGLNGRPAFSPSGYIAPAYCACTLARKPSRELQNLSNDAEWKPFSALPIPSNADFMETVVIVNCPLVLIGKLKPASLYINCIDLFLVIVREALRSILRLRAGSRVAFRVKSSVLLVAAGVVASLSPTSHSFSNAFPT